MGLTIKSAKIFFKELILVMTYFFVRAMVFLSVFIYLKNPLSLLFVRSQRNRYIKHIRFINNLSLQVDRENAHLIEFLCYLLLKGWHVTQLRGNDLLLEKEGFFIIAPFEKIEVFSDNFEQEYHQVDFRGKVVVDIGGFIGETAVLFKRWGAKKVIIYEALPENYKYIELNTRINKVDAEIIVCAVSNNHSEIEIHTPLERIGTTSFGLFPGSTRIKLDGCSWNSVLERSIKDDAQIIKVDCEGCERFITTADRTLVKKIPIWIIEAHGQMIKKDLLAFFQRLGYRCKSSTDKYYKLLKDYLSILVFYREVEVR